MSYKVKIKGIEEDRIARSKGMSLPISFKQSVELTRALRGKKLSEAYVYLDRIAALKQAVPYKRYNSNIPHRKGKIGPGRFPVKTAKTFKKVLRNAEVNALAKGLDNTSLVIFHIAADKAASNFRPGRHRGRRGKSTHLEVVLKEVISEKKKKETRAKAKAKTKKKPSAAEKKSDKEKTQASTAKKKETKESKNKEGPEDKKESEKDSKPESKEDDSQEKNKEEKESHGKSKPDEKKSDKHQEKDKTKEEKAPSPTSKEVKEDSKKETQKQAQKDEKSKSTSETKKEEKKEESK